VFGRQNDLFPDHDPIRHGSGLRRRRLVLPRDLHRQAVGAPELQGDAWREAHAILIKWADLEEKGRLAGAGEPSLRGEFLTEVFGRALGYTLFSENAPYWNLRPEFSVNGLTADAAIGVFRQNRTPMVRAVVEIKGPTVDLDRDRSRGRTPVQQLWDYLNALPECPWGVLTNLVSFRLYHRDRTPHAYELMTLQNLREEKNFREFFVLFARPGLVPATPGQLAYADVLLRNAEARQKEVGDELYEKYSQERLALIHHLHEKAGLTVDGAIRAAQKLLDRIVFIAFCEDRDLLPPETIDRAWKNVAPFARVTNPKWRNFLELFRSVDAGNRPAGIEPYNGGLFREDAEVDNLDLKDEWTQFFRDLGRYDFRDEVNVDVLGHLFERSVTEIEKLRAGGLFAEPLPAARARGAMPKSAQRKRFGIYYTPPAFTGLIVRHTIDAVLDRRFAEIAARLGCDGDTSEAAQRRDESLPYWSGCLEILRDLKVCDPACGSGAFLIRAYDRLEERYDEVVDGLRRAGHPDADTLGDGIPDRILRDNLFGVDLSEEAVEITQLALWIRSARRGRTLADLSANVVCGNSLVDDPAVDPKTMNWEATFPAVFGGDEPGFDCVIGNPPWERLKLQEREFFSHSAPDIAGTVSAADRRKKIALLERTNPDLYARYLDAGARAERMLDSARTSGRFPLTGKGDINTYVLFAELARTLVAGDGRAGLLVPSGIATDDTTKRFLRALMEEGSLVLLYDFENKLPHFPDIHRSFKFCALIFGGSRARCDRPDFVFFAHTLDDLKDTKRHITLSAEDLALVNPNTKTCPIFRTRRDADLTRRIYGRVPVLIDRNRKAGGNPWGIKFLRMFDQTNEAELFHTPDRLAKTGYKRAGNRWKKGKQVFLPLYEAKMVQAYDHRAASVVVEKENWMRQGQTVPTSLVSHQNQEFTVEPRWWVAREEVLGVLGDRVQPAYPCFKDVTSPTNRRTMIAAFIPLAAVVNSAPLILTGDGIGVRASSCLVANLNSLVLDFVARQKVGNIHLNFFIVEQFPILPPDAYEERCPWDLRHTLERWISERVLKLTCTAEDMRPLADAAGFPKGVHKWKEPERGELMAELDAAYFHLYGLSRDDVAYVLSTFSAGRQGPAAGPEATGALSLMLAAYDRLGSTG